MTDRTARAAAYLALATAIFTLAAVIIPATIVTGPVYGGGVNPTPNPAEQARDAARVPVLPSDFVGARVTSSTTQVSTETGLVFDTARWDSGGWWDAATPTRLTFPSDGICDVHAQATILGTAYYGKPATNISLLVRRDGDPTAFVVGTVRTDESPEGAVALGAATTDWFEAGEYVEMFVEPPGLTVESNWPGRANLSPVLLVACR